MPITTASWWPSTSSGRAACVGSTRAQQRLVGVASMDFEFTPEQEAFRAEVRAFLKNELPATWEKGFWMEEDTDERCSFPRQFQRKVGEKGWLALAWPKEFGGLGATIVEQLIFNEEMAYHGVSSFGFGPLTVAPALMMFGS